jgi:hypothetical protein
MTVEQLRRYLRHEPFMPFAIHLADCRALLVRHPEVMVLSNSGRTADVHSEFDEFETIDCLLIVSLRQLAEIEIRGIRLR